MSWTALTLNLTFVIYSGLIKTKHNFPIYFILFDDIIFRIDPAPCKGDLFLSVLYEPLAGQLSVYEAQKQM